LHEIIFYKDKKGNSPVLDYMRELKQSSSKDSSIKLNKIGDYIQALSEYGTEQLTEKYVKRIEGEIWELRPLKNRIFFAGVVGGRYVLLHCFAKKTPKTPKLEIEKAKRELLDYKERSGLYEKK